MAERGMDDAIDQKQGESECAKHEIVHVHQRRQVDDAEKRPARNGLDTVLAAGEWRLHGDEVHQLGKREGDHGEVDAALTHCQDAVYESEKPAGGSARKQRKLGGNPPNLRGMRADVGRPAQEGCVPE